MPCLFAILGLIAPRFLLFCIFVFSNWFSQAYETVVWPLLGFLFMPCTTLIYMGAMLNNDHVLGGWWMVLFVFGIFFDLSTQFTVSVSGD